MFKQNLNDQVLGTLGIFVLGLDAFGFWERLGLFSFFIIVTNSNCMSEGTYFKIKEAVYLDG